MPIQKPNLNHSSIDRLLDCEEAMESAFDGATDILVAEAIDAGWTEEEAEEAVAGLAQSRVFARQTRSEIDARVAKANGTGH